MNAAVEFLAIPASVGRRARRVRPEADPRLTETSIFDKRNGWTRGTLRDGRRGYARPSTVAGVLVFVPDDAEAVAVQLADVALALSGSKQAKAARRAARLRERRRERRVRVA